MALDEEPENIIVPGQGLRRVVPLNLVSAIGFSGKRLIFQDKERLKIARDRFWSLTVLLYLKFM